MLMSGRAKSLLHEKYLQSAKKLFNGATKQKWPTICRNTPPLNSPSTSESLLNFSLSNKWHRRVCYWLIMRKQDAIIHSKCCHTSSLYEYTTAPTYLWHFIYQLPPEVVRTWQCTTSSNSNFWIRFVIALAIDDEAKYRPSEKIF